MKRIKYSPSTGTRTELKARLERFVVLSLQGHEDEWFQLCVDLGIDPIAVEQLSSVVHEGKWRDSTAPRLFLMITAKRRLSKETAGSGLLADDVEGTAQKKNLGFRDEEYENQRIHIESVPDWSNIERQQQKAWASLYWLFELLYATPTYDDWHALEPTLLRAYDKDEVEVLRARVQGFTRELYLEEAISPEDRKQRQAAWRRFQRKGLPASLRKELRQASSARLASPEWELRAERDGLEEYQNEYDPRWTYGAGRGRRTKPRRPE